MGKSSKDISPDHLPVVKCFFFFTFSCSLSTICRILSSRAASRNQIGINELVEVSIHHSVHVA